MATLTVLKFITADGAEDALHRIQSLQQEQLITLHDAALVTWPEGKKGPKTRQLVNLPRTGALDGAFWGLLLGLIFFAPLLGIAVGAALGAAGGSLIDVGIDDKFIKEVKGKVTEGTSALFLMTSGAVFDKVQDAFQDREFEIIATNLSEEQEEKLRTAFGS